ncbi:MAG: ABC transporter ATP-binding protein [Patescibacteria group bacterium]|nr:ABC transporter ATP-binding protein [Patescibacteria group bacterium]
MIQTQNICKSFYLEGGQEIPVLRGVDLEVQKGEFVALMGDSGGGKSTLLNVIGCLHPATFGSYFLDGEDIGHISDDYTLAFIRNRKIGFIFQSFNLLHKLSALKNVALPGIYHGMPKEEREQKASQLLIDMGLFDHAEHRPTKLSGGQQQRVAIARALINDPQIILADEPTGALDSHTGEEIMKIFMKLKSKGKTILMVTHSPSAAHYADRIIFMRDGRIIDQNYKIPK